MKLYNLPITSYFLQSFITIFRLFRFFIMAIFTLENLDLLTKIKILEIKLMI